MDNVNLPWYLDLPWLTKQYVRAHAWYPVPQPLLGEEPFMKSPFGRIPCKSCNEFQLGDVIIFSDYDERKDAQGRIESDRFYVVTKEEINDYLANHQEIERRTCLLPIGVVVHPPWANTTFSDRRERSALLKHLSG